jgi:cation diffusion facilitator family transporter
VLISGSVALLADTIHNFSDALTAVPLWIAFTLSKRVASRRYTYGFGRAEDIAGTVVVLMILTSALIAGWESYRKFAEPTPMSNVGWVIAAAIIGFLGNEAVAIFRIRVGNEIGSAALVADGQHARVDGFTSLAVLFGAVGSLLGFPLADPIIGALITVAILFIVKDAAVAMWHRLMDAIEPEVIDQVERAAAGVPGVQGVNEARARWLGHALSAELHIVVDEDLPTHASHSIAEEVRHALFHAQPRLATITIHVDPCGHGGADHHAPTQHHVRA